ncbi:MAG: NAD(P)H-binding protein [Desulfobacterota bacterium]|nr:NAD(P)H-binding protein [Thermodesulfobacteriota bacterium]
MNVLVIGATGDVGSEAAKAAVAKGHTVAALVRPSSNTNKLGDARQHIRLIEGDILEPLSLERAIANNDAIMISIRLTPGEMKKNRTYRDVEQHGVENIVAAATKASVKKLVFVSAAGVGPTCVSDMYQAKYAAEEAIRKSGIDHTIFRPSGMFKDFDFFHIPTVLKLGATNRWPYGPIDIHMNPLSHLDLATCMVLALDNPRAAFLTLEIGGPDCITQGELLNMIARIAGIQATYTEGVSKEQLIAMVRANPQQGFFTAEQLEDFIVDKMIDHKPVYELFGIPFQTVKAYLQETVPRIKAALNHHPQQFDKTPA